MKNLFYYLKKNGSLSFREYALNEVDGLILCQLAYINWDKFLRFDDEVNMVSLFNEENYNVITKDTIFEKKNLKLIKLLRKIPRYQDVKVTHLVNTLCYEDVEQFFAITYIIDDYVYVAFRGTDITILGWKENFNMTYLDEVPAQRDSVKYVNRVFELHKLPLYIGGHSKGGNLALYSAINSDDKINDFIIKVHNFDGPGYNTDISYNEKFILLKDKILTFTTQKAIIGVLMYYVDNLIFIGAKGISLLQHVSYQWKVDKGGLLHRVKRNSLQSRFFARSIRYFFENTSEYERKRFVDLVFTIIEVSPSNSVKIFKRHPFNFIGKMRRRYKGISKDDKRFFKSVLKKFRFSFFMALKVKLSELRG